MVNNLISKIRSQRIVWYLQISVIVLGFLIFLLGFYLGTNTNESTKYTSTPVIGSEASNYEMPVIELPVLYFAKNRIVGSWVSTSGEKYTVVSEGYHSAPTTTIGLLDDAFDNMSEYLPPLKSREEILQSVGNYTNLVQRVLEQDGELARHFLPEEVISDVKKFDVDDDGIEEQIISLCSLGSNHCPDKILIVKNERIIFRITGVVNPEITEADTSSGFYLHWSPWRTDGSKWDVGLCCMPGYFKTRFVNIDGEFLPVYEQEVLNFSVKDSVEG